MYGSIEVCNCKIRDGTSMNDYLNNLINLLKPTVCDLDDMLNLLELEKSNLDNVTKLLKWVNDDVSKMGSYEDQNLIITNLKNVNSNETEYKACCYLVNSDDKNICLLPQYLESSNYIERLINYFKKWREDLLLKVAELEITCSDKKMNKKYLEIFEKENPVITDVDEFSEFLEKQELSDDNKISLLVYTIKNNVSFYLEKDN